MSHKHRDYIWHSQNDASVFIKGYFDNKKILFIGSVGFDPRTFKIFQELQLTAKDNIKPIFILEVRELVSEPLKASAAANLGHLKTLLGDKLDLHPINIFAEDDRAVIGGRSIVEFAQRLDLNSCSEIIIDISAMSRGVFFPLVLCLRKMIEAQGAGQSLHVFVIDHPELDYSYLPQYEDRPDYMHGFDGGVKKVGTGDQIKLWLPQLTPKRGSIYEALYSFISPTDVCPVLPFPGISAKRVDELAYEYRDEMQTWNTELQNMFLASESHPLDLYNTVHRIHISREELFRDIYNTFTVLSPLGTKVSTIGGMLAAMDLDLPVAYVETAGYQSLSDLPSSDNDGKLVHVWVDGPVYPD
jgi:hypothetical protein